MIPLSTPISWASAGVNVTAKDGLWVIVMWQCSLIPLVGDGDGRGACARVRAGGGWDLGKLSSQFCYKPETALKGKIYFQKWKRVWYKEYLKTRVVKTSSYHTFSLASIRTGNFVLSWPRSRLTCPSKNRISFGPSSLGATSRTY